MLRTVCKIVMFAWIHPSLLWCVSRKEGRHTLVFLTASKGIGSKSKAKGGKQRTFCLCMPMTLTLFAWWGQKELWGLDTFRDILASCCPDVAHIQSPVTSLLSCILHPCTPGSAEQKCSWSFIRHLEQREFFPWATWTLIKHNLADLKRNNKSMRSWQNVLKNFNSNIAPPATWFFKLSTLAFPLPGPFPSWIFTETTQEPENGLRKLTKGHTPLDQLNYGLSYLSLYFLCHYFQGKWLAKAGSNMSKNEHDRDP